MKSDSTRIGIPDGVRNVYVLPFFIEQVDREGIELNEPSDELGNPLQQLIQIDHSRDLAAQVEQRQQNVALTQARRGRRIERRRRRLTHAGGPACARLRRAGLGTQELYCPRMTSLQLPLDYAAIERILPHRYPF